MPHKQHHVSSLYLYIGTCVNLPGPLIRDMVSRSRPITRRTFLRYVRPSREDCRLYPSNYGVSYHRSTYDGRRCVYMDHSCIEHVFTEQT